MGKRHGHPGEFLKTGLAHSGRIAGDGIISDNYDDESFPDPGHTSVSAKIHNGTPVGNGTEEEESPVITYFIDVENLK
jgi:hypothetical protein